MINALYAQIAQPARLKPLHLEEPLDHAANTLGRVDRGEFFRRFEVRHAVQYFYEPFLEAFDPELRKELGVWYTPEEIVQYMVARIDRALVSELGIADGLADPQVYVLDPCCGTGTYLVETLRVIGDRLRTKGADALAAQPRVVDLCGSPPISGLQEMRRGTLMDMDRARLEARMQRYFDPKLSWDTILAEGAGPTRDAGGL